MGIYTVYDEPEVDKQIESILKYITGRIKSLIGEENIQAVILTGGFGRGEGGIIINDNSTLHLVNDFDINIVAKPTKYRNIKLKYNSRLEQLAQELAAKVGIKQIDLGISHPARFYFMPYNVGSYEYQNGCKLIYGYAKIKKHIKANKLPVTDGTQYFLNRGSGMLIPTLYFLNKKAINEKNRENFLIEINKFILAMGDSYLLLKKEYHYSYTQRVVIAEKLNFDEMPGGILIKEKYIDALNWKVRPEIHWLGYSKMVKHWFEIRKIANKYFLWFENTRLKTDYKNWEEYCNSIYLKQGDFSQSVVRKSVKGLINNPLFIFNRGKRSEVFKKHFSAKLSIMPSILFSLKEDEAFNEELLFVAKQNLKKFYNVDTNTNWLKIAKRYLQIFHPGGVVYRLTN